jgi:hypothetical protein
MNQNTGNQFVNRNNPRHLKPYSVTFNFTHTTITITTRTRNGQNSPPCSWTVDSKDKHFGIVFLCTGRTTRNTDHVGRGREIVDVGRDRHDPGRVAPQGKTQL